MDSSRPLPAELALLWEREEEIEVTPELENEEVALLCAHAPPQFILSSKEHHQVIRLPGDLVVKVGLGVTAEEFRFQRMAYSIVDKRVVRVPRVHKFFNLPYSLMRMKGYLVMEFIPGTTALDVGESQISRIMPIVRYLFSIRADAPCGLTKGKYRGQIFSRADDLVPKDIRALATWIDRRLPTGSTKVDLSLQRPGLCHLDIQPEHVIWPLPGRPGPPGLISWKSAAFVPRIFEVLSHKIAARDLDASLDTRRRFHERLYRRMLPLTDHEEKAFHKLLQAYDYSQRCYVFVPPFLRRRRNTDTMDSPPEDIPKPPFHRTQWCYVFVPPFLRRRVYTDSTDSPQPSEPQPPVYQSERAPPPPSRKY